MLDNTYDIPGIKFYLVFFNDKNNEVLNYVNIEEKCDKLVWVKFEDVDGFTIRDIQKGLGIKNFAVIGGMIVTFERGLRDVSKCVSGNIILDVNSDIISDDDRSMTIDSMCERQIVYNYNHCYFGNSLDKLYKCFLQRYRYGNKDNTDKKMLELKK